MIDETSVLMLITAMGVISIGSRTMGYVAMRWVPTGGFVERCLRALPAAVIISILAPVLAAGDWGERAALLLVPVLVAFRVNLILAVVAGVAIAASTRALV